MQKSFIPALLTLSASFFYIAVLLFLHVPQQRIEQFIAVFITLLVSILYAMRFAKTKAFMVKNGFWLLLFLGSTIIHLTIISTGGFFSPFFILLHIAILTCCFIFSIYVGFSYLIFSVLILIMQLLIYQNFALVKETSSTTFLLDLISLIGIIPVSLILAGRYHFKDSVANMLQQQVAIDESLLERVHDLIFVTDKRFTIISINEAVEREFYQSEAELIHVPFFDVILLKDRDGRLLTSDAGVLEHAFTIHEATILEDFVLISPATAPRKVTVGIKPIPDINGDIDQFSFIISPAFQATHTVAPIHTMLEDAMTRHYAKVKNLQLLLKNESSSDIRLRFSLVSKSEQDLLLAQEIEDHGLKEHKGRVDVASLCRQIVNQEHEFANLLAVSLHFSLDNFGSDDIMTLGKPTFEVTPEQLTGPFFTVSSDVKLLSFTLQRLLDLSILLTHQYTNPQVVLRVKKNAGKTILISFETNSTVVTQEASHDLFVPYYGTLGTRTAMRTGSGLEGYLAKQIAQELGITIHVLLSPQQNKLTLSAELPI